MGRLHEWGQTCVREHEVRTQAGRASLVDRPIGGCWQRHTGRPKMGRRPFGEALQAVVNDQTANGRKSVAHTEGRITNHLLKHFNTNRLLSSVSTNDLTEYTALRLAAGASAASVVITELAIVKNGRSAWPCAPRSCGPCPMSPCLHSTTRAPAFSSAREFESMDPASVPPALRGSGDRGVSHRLARAVRGAPVGMEPGRSRPARDPA